MDSQETQNLNNSSLSTTFREQISLPRSDRVNLSPLSPLRISPPRLSPLSPLRISPDRPPITISPPILVISDDEGSLSGFSVRSLGMESSLTFNYDSNMEELPHNSNNFSSRFRSASNYLNDENRTTPTQSNAYEVNEDDTTDEDEIVPDSVDRLHNHDHDSPERRNEETEQDDSDNGDDFLPNSIPDLQQSANQIFDNQNSESLDSEDHLFAPEEPPEINNTLSRNMIPPSGIPHRYFSCLTPSLLPVGTRYYSSRSGNWLVPRTSYRSRYSTSSSLGLGSNTASSSASDCPLNLTSSRRLPAYWLNRSRLLSLRNRTRSTYERLFHPFNTTPASEVTNSAMENGNLNDVSSDLMYRIRRHPRFLSEDDESENVGNPSSNTPYRPPDTLQSSRPHRSDSMDNFSLLQSLFNIPEIAIRSPVVSTVGSCARARSVSPGVPSSWFGLGGSDEALDDSVVDIRNRDDRSRHSSSMHADFVRFVNGNHNEAQIERPNTPLPPPVSDDESTIARNSTNSSQPATVITSTAAVEAASSNSTKPPGLKEIPQTYEEMNHELIQLLECPICFEYATPPINQCLQGHIICTNCRKRVNSCPTCRNMFQESRNLIMEKVAALLRYPCKNAITGCVETLFLLQKEQHERSCGFRHYLCFVPTCNWRGYKPELLVHVQETHENHVIIGGSVNLLIPITGQTKKVWLMSAFNELFYVIFFATLGILKGCVRFIGDSSKSDNYTYTISVTSDEEMLRNLNYTRTTHAYEETNENFDILDSYDLFSISYQSLSTFRRGTRAPVRVTVEEVPNRSRTTT